jgi:hypothetical protein
MPPIAAPVALPTAEHRVAGDSAPQPRRVHPITDRADRAAPFVSESERVRATQAAELRLAVVKEFDVGAANANTRDIDYYLTGSRRGRRRVDYGSDTRPGHDKGLH